MLIPWRAISSSLDIAFTKFPLVSPLSKSIISFWFLSLQEHNKRQNINNIGSGTGYYISEGYAIPIKWEKKYKASQTIYTYMDGTEISVNDGNTWIHIQPTSKKLTINGQKES